MGNSDNRKRGVNSRQNEKNREALIAVLTVCLIGVLVTWFWRDEDPTTPVTNAEWALSKMKDYFPQNVNFMLNLSPSTTGLVDDNLAQEFARIGKTCQMPAPLDELPAGWLKR